MSEGLEPASLGRNAGCISTRSGVYEVHEAGFPSVLACTNALRYHILEDLFWLRFLVLRKQHRLGAALTPIGGVVI